MQFLTHALCKKGAARQNIMCKKHTPLRLCGGIRAAVHYSTKRGAKSAVVLQPGCTVSSLGEHRGLQGPASTLHRTPQIWALSASLTLVGVQVQVFYWDAFTCKKLAKKAPADSRNKKTFTLAGNLETGRWNNFLGKMSWQLELLYQNKYSIHRHNMLSEIWELPATTMKQIQSTK